MDPKEDPPSDVAYLLLISTAILIAALLNLTHPACAGALP